MLALRNCCLRAFKEAVKLTQPDAACASLQQIRATHVFKRKDEPKLVPKWKDPRKARLKAKNYVYEVTDTNLKPVPNIKCILTQYVEGIGSRGDVVEVKRSLFRGVLCPAGSAVYASPENLTQFEKERQASGAKQEPKRTKYSVNTLQQLSGFTLLVPMNAHNPWTLDKSHIRIAFRKMGVEVKDHCITLPETTITHDGDVKQFSVGITINGIDKVDVKACIAPWSPDEIERKKLKPPVVVWQPRQTIVKSFTPPVVNSAGSLSPPQSTSV